MINTKQDLMAVIRDLREELQDMARQADEMGLVDFPDGTYENLVEMTEDITLGVVKLCESPQEAV